MTSTEQKELQAKAKKEVATPAEQTRPGIVFTPAVDIFENETAITVLADMPGVKAGDLNIDLRDHVLTLTGDVQAPEGPDEKIIAREYRIGRYMRQFTLSEAIDQDKVEAKLTDGVLRLSLPKVAAAQPRKIEVKAA